MTLAAGSTLGPFRIIDLLGRGGMASVYKAYEAELDRYVALKILPPEFLHEDTFAKRFEREARIVARLEHPNIVPIHRYGIDDGIPWMSMRMLPVGSLAGLLEECHLERARVVAILKQVAEALDHAHAEGVVHRDVKPSNVLLDDKERVYVGDFGVAHLAEASVVLTRTGSMAGTPNYMAPEQALAQGIDYRTDIYALGVVAYEMLTGRVPYSADTPVAVLMKHVSEPLPMQPLEQLPEQVTRAILKALAKAPDQRWSSATAFIEALGDEQIAAGDRPTRLLDQPTPRGLSRETNHTSTLPTQKVGVDARISAVGIDRTAPSSPSRFLRRWWPLLAALLLGAIALMWASTLVDFAPQAEPVTVIVRDPGLYVTADARAGDRLTPAMVAMVEVVKDGEQAGGSDRPLDYGRDVRGSCLLVDVLEGHRIGWSDIGTCVD